MTVVTMNDGSEVTLSQCGHWAVCNLTEEPVTCLDCLLE